MHEESIYPVRIYIEDVDGFGMVYHANYLKYFERARTEYLRALGFEQDELFAQGIFFVVYSVDINFHAPARFNEKLQINSTIQHIKGASMEFAQRIERIDDEKVSLICSAVVKIACVNREHRPLRIPSFILEALHGSKSITLDVLR